MSHGTNTKEMRTTATYDPIDRCFVLNTPDYQASKFWVGNLGKNATHAVVAAQLFIEGNSKGLHWFIVQIRDLVDHLPLPGVQVGDIGPKMGWNWIDHGFLLFDHVRIPKENLLDKYQDVTPDGKYILKVPEKHRFGLSLAALSSGRVDIAFNATESAKIALTIAVRYSFVRKQFGPPSQPEQPVIEYQMQQQRLLPFLSGSIVMGLFCQYLMREYRALVDSKGEVNGQFLQLNSEIHAISCGAKPITTWYARDAIQTCRECCGGHGYSIYSRLGLLYVEHDPSLTYEGENNVLIQQLARYLISALQYKNTSQTISSPLGSINYLNGWENKIGSRCIYNQPEQFLNGGYIDALEWRVIYLLNLSSLKLMKLSATGDNWSTWNNSQAFHLHTASKAHMECLIVRTNLKLLSEMDPKFNSIKPVLQKMCDLYALSCIRESLDLFLEGSYFTAMHSIGIKDLILNLCSQIQPDAVSIVDSIAYPDKLLWSALGQSDGEVYKHLYGKVLSSKRVFERSRSWELLRTPVDMSIKSKM
eukprot:TRINITY_DN4654_c0_g1_i3.p1 TRINITY_DN4654_c0_g1~~TRINITY_DN4654_c0_g1_i3.p1  ORF type:complete len:532 (-),score=72.37 TRINITY_DN4654_c0_g1_i3:76-1671(-)